MKETWFNLFGSRFLSHRSVVLGVRLLEGTGVRINSHSSRTLSSLFAIYFIENWEVVRLHRNAPRSNPIIRGNDGRWFVWLQIKSGYGY